MKKLLAAVLALALSPVMAGDVDPNVADARKAAMMLGKDLKMTLQTAMKSGGPVAALGACNTAAPGIATKVSAATGWTVARTSLKERNEGNKPDAWEKKVLEQFESRKQAGEDPKKLEYSETLTVNGEKTFRYMKAIPTAKVCMNCHGGDNVKAEVVAKLKELYPNDRARGFKAGDLRGAFTLSKKM